MKAYATLTNIYATPAKDLFEQWDSWTRNERTGAPYRNCIKLAPRSPDSKKFFKYLQTRGITANHRTADGKFQCWGIRVLKNQ